VLNTSGWQTLKKKVLVSIEVVNWKLQVETGKNHGKVDSLSQWLHTVLNGCGPKWNASWSQFLQIFISHSPQFSARVQQWPQNFRYTIPQSARHRLGKFYLTQEDGDKCICRSSSWRFLRFDRLNNCSAHLPQKKNITNVQEAQRSF